MVTAHDTEKWVSLNPLPLFEEATLLGAVTS